MEPHKNQMLQLITSLPNTSSFAFPAPAGDFPNGKGVLVARQLAPRVLPLGTAATAGIYWEKKYVKQMLIVRQCEARVFVLHCSVLLVCIGGLPLPDC